VAINTTTVEASLQLKLDATTGDTDNKEFLILGKSMQSIVGVIAVGEVLDEGANQITAVQNEGAVQIDRVTDVGDDQIGLVTLEGTTQVAAVQAIADDISIVNVAETRSASIDMDDNLFLQPELRDYTETVQAMAADDVDCSLGSVHTKTISADVTLTFSNPPAAGKTAGFTLVLEMSNASVITWPATVKWAFGGVIPESTSTGTDIFTFMTIDGGTVWFAFTVGQEMS
jgi:hypothetical protein